MHAKKMLSTGIEIVLALVVFAFLGLKSLDFFVYATPSDQWYLSWLGFGLTGGGVIGYLAIFMWQADSDSKKVISLIMLFVSMIGELITAGFGMQVAAWEKSGLAMTQSEFDAMIFAVQLLGLLHAVALIAYVAGDKIGEVFADKNKNGIPDGFERKNKNNQNSQQPPALRQFANDTEEIEALQKRLAELNPTSGAQSQQPPQPK